MGMSEDLEDVGMLMDWASACRHQHEGKVVVRVAWGSLRPRQASIEDRQAEDWVVVAARPLRPSAEAHILSQQRAKAEVVRQSGRSRR